MISKIVTALISSINISAPHWKRDQRSEEVAVRQVSRVAMNQQYWVIVEVDYQQQAKTGKVCSIDCIISLRRIHQDLIKRIKVEWAKATDQWMRVQ